MSMWFSDNEGNRVLVDPRDNPLPVTFVPDRTSGVVDAFGRQRVSNTALVFDSKQLHDKQPLFWDESITDTSGNATSTHSTTDAATSMYVEAQDQIIRQTKMRFNYQPGKSQFVAMTGILTAGGTGITGRIGQFDANDGVFFQVSGTTIGVAVRKATTDNVIAQSAWNIDKLDGTGPSGITINFDKAQIFIFDYEWLGVGRVRFGIYQNGLPYYCHEVTHANILTGAYMSTPNNPLRYEIASAAGGASVTMKHICASVQSEGGIEPLGVVQAISTAGTHVDANSADTIYAVLGMRLKSTHLDTAITIEKLGAINEGAQDFEWMLLLNPTVGGTFTYADVANASIQRAAGATTNTITADAWDAILAAGYIKSGNQGGAGLDSAGFSPPVIRLGAQIDGTRDTMVFAVRPLAANADIQATITYRDFT